tara:strand:+ start:86 stop:865 length:780 start_codon:yes stop_codon:yes gene_type:complete
MSLTNKTPSETYKDLLTIDNSNNGVDSTSRTIKTGNGTATSTNISDRSLQIRSNTDNTAAFSVRDSGGSTRLIVDTTNGTVKAMGHHLNTQYKTFGIYDFSPAAGYHYPLISNNMMFSDSGDDFIATNDFGNGTDPATSWDASGGTPKIVVACMWQIPDNIYIDSAKIFITADADSAYEVHINSYDISIGIGHEGDLSNGTTHATFSGSTQATSAKIRIGALTIGTPAISADKVVLAFIENVTGTGDLTASIQLKYHLV